MPRSHRWQLGHRPALDGLRGVAVLLVIAAHYGAPFLLGGGAAGVTVFFVLSGFLITALLLGERETTGRIDVAAFYRRRARRLLPALVVVLITTVVIGAWLSDPLVVPQALATLFYVANLFEPHEPLGHTWTLSAEEQFYLVWPAVVIGLAWLRPGALGLVAAAVALVLVPGPYVLSAFGAIAAGAALAVVAVDGRLPAIGRLTWMLLVPIGIASAFAYGAETSVLLRVVVVIASLGLIAAAARDTAPCILAWGPLSFVGRISYGLYLWHVPVRWGLTALGIDQVWTLATPLGVALSFLAAAVSWRYLEQPILSRGRRQRPLNLPYGERVPSPSNAG